MVGVSEEIKIDISNLNAFRKLFDNFYTVLCLFAERYTEDSELAADIVQDCFIKLWQRREDFSFLHQVKSFLYTSVRNSALNELERLKVRENYADKVLTKNEDSFFRDQVVEEESYRILICSIEKLPAQTRKVMMLALEGKDNKQIAAELSVSDGTIHTLKKIAYKRLRTDLKDYFYLVIPFFFHI